MGPGTGGARGPSSAGVRACAIGSLIRPLGFIGFRIRFYRFYRCLGLVCSSEFGFRV